MPAHKDFVHRALDWEKVSQRLKNYSCIAEEFPLHELQKYAAKAPYYCHQIAWRLGTWQDETPFQVIDQLLQSAGALSGWNARNRLLGQWKNEEFWSVIWELQTAAFFSHT